MADLLNEIVAHKQREIAQRREAVPLRDLERRAESADPPRGFRRALVHSPDVQIIAEIKRASPSAGVLNAEVNAVRQAQLYIQGGAACLSVLTDKHFFHGALEDLEAVRQAISVPVLRKDFVIDVYQVIEARAAGADAVLLIAEILDDRALKELFASTRHWGMDALVEFHLPENLPRILEIGADLVGINNRDLRTFQTNIEHTLHLGNRIPSPICLVSESGIRTREDIVRLQRLGVKAVLIGETLMRSPDPVSVLQRLRGLETPH